MVKGNRPRGSGRLPGRDRGRSSAALGGSNAAHNLIVSNRARRNQPADILWDGKGKGNEFEHNRCTSSQPERALPVDERSILGPGKTLPGTR